MGAKLFLDNVNYPQVDKLSPRQVVNLTLSGQILSKNTNGVIFQIDAVSIGKGKKMSTGEILIANRLNRIEENQAGVAARP